MNLKTVIVAAAAAFVFVSAPAQADSLTASANHQSALASAERALERGDADSALLVLEDARRGLRHDGDIARVESMRCVALHALTRYEDAEAACSIAIDTRTAHWSDYNNRGAARIKLGDYDGAIDDLHQANLLRRGASAVRRNLARATALRDSQAVASN